MKNVHILPTDNYSPLVYSTNKYRGIFLSKYYSPMKNMGDSYHHIYITNDVEIKEGDYVCASGGFRFVKTLNKDRARTFEDDGIVSKQNPSSSCHLSNYKKIILTTDQDLIKDGVQAIDDTFLEWFVKNPSCEEVEVQCRYNFYAGQDLTHYKIIIPKEEQCSCKVGEPYNNACCKIHGSIPKKEPKQDLPIVNGSYGCTIQTKEQENTLEEAAERLYPVHKMYFPTSVEDLNKIPRSIFIDGAKWQQEQDRWKTVLEETPPSNIELLVQSPEGIVHLSSWRESYNIFSCQDKSESSSDWKWKTI